MAELTTTIQLKRSTKEQLDKLGSKTDSYDDIIVRLLKPKPTKKGGHH